MDSAGAMWSARGTLSALTAQKLNRRRSGSHRRRRRFRPRTSLGFVAAPMLYRRTTNPSRRRIVRHAAETPVFHGTKRSLSRPRRSGTQERPRRSGATLHARSVRTELKSCTQPATPSPARATDSRSLFRLVHIVRAAPELDVLDRRGTTGGVGLDMVELEEPALGTAPMRSDERALAGIALPHLPLHGGRNVARAAATSRPARGCSVVASLARSRSDTRSVSARSKMAAGSPVGSSVAAGPELDGACHASRATR